MAQLNLDDLIGSMQHSCNAGDRGDDIQTMRESLRATLGTQALGPPNHNNQFNNRQQQIPSIYQTSQSQRRGGSQNHQGGTSSSSRGGWSTNELSSSFGRSTNHQNGIQVPSTTPTSTQFFSSGSMEKRRNHLNGVGTSHSNGGNGVGGNPSSMTFSDSSSSNNSNSSFGTGNLQAPTNTPLQTPVENGELENRYYAAATIQGGEGRDENLMQRDDVGDHNNYDYQNQSFNESGHDGGGRFTRRVVGGFNNQTSPTNGFEIPPQNA